MTRERKLGLIGPRMGGKTQFKVFVLKGYGQPPAYLSTLYQLTPRNAAKEETTNDITILLRDGAVYQHDQDPTQSVTPLEVDFQDDEGLGRAATAHVLDFSGGVWVNASTKGPFEELKKVDDFIFLIPFWQLFPTSHGCRALLELNEDPADPVTESKVKFLSDTLRGDGRLWLKKLTELAIEKPRRRRVVVGVSHLGGRLLSACTSALAGVPGSESVRKSLLSLVEASDALMALSSRNAVGIFGCLRAMEAERRLRTRTREFIDRCATSGSTIAQGILGLPTGWRIDMVAFNVIEGTREKLEIVDAGGAVVTEEYFKQEVRNAHLLLLPFWQNAVAEWVW